jgi:hypothetical protein
MNIREILNEDAPRIRRVKKENADGSVSVTYEVLNSKGVTVKTGMSREIAKSYLNAHRGELSD